jgi:hypothetical protein
MLCAALVASASWTPQSHAFTHVARAVHPRTRLLTAKNDGDEPAPQQASANIAVGSICEFHDPKHGSGKKQAVLGVCEGSSFKAKGGEVISLVDAGGKKHTVASKAIHIVLPPSKGKSVDPAELLAPYAEIAEKDSMSLGVEPDLLELAWEMSLAEEAKEVSPKQIMGMIDETLYQSALDRYKAFRLLTSDLGQVFFKSLSGNAFKPRSESAVQSTKMAWCHAPSHETEEFCFV